jgi:hypothetical protein
MTRGDFVAYQHAGMREHLAEFVRLCRRRFLYAADLLEMNGPAIETLRDFGQIRPIDVVPLFPAWRVLCDRYLVELYDPQLRLFGNPETDAVYAWTEFVHRRLFERLVRDDELVRNVLRGLGGLPCRSPAQAVQGVFIYLSGMTLPNSAPAWAPETPPH